MYKLYPKTLENINDDIEKLNESLLKCQEEEFLVPNRIVMSYNEEIDNLNNDIMYLIRDNTQIQATLSYGEMLFKIVFGVGIVLCLFLTYKYTGIGVTKPL